MANTFDRLMKADAKKADEMATGTFKSKQLARILGESEPVEITFREVPQKKLYEYIDGCVDANANIDMPKTYESNVQIVVAALVDPDLKNKELQEHFGCKMAVDLAEKLFRNEISDIALAIKELGGIEEGSEGEIKN